MDPNVRRSMIFEVVTSFAAYKTAIRMLLGLKASSEGALAVNDHIRGDSKHFF